MNNSKYKNQNTEFSIFHPTYFSTIFQTAKMLQVEKLIFEIEDNFQKQTYRNRCYILGANGKQLLNIPVQKISGKQKTKEIKIDYIENWQKLHLKSLNTAYRSSPFFEYYIDDLKTIFNKKETYLIDLNIKIFEIVCRLLPLKKNYEKNNFYKKEVVNDFRYLVNSKKETNCNFPKYTQVFSNKYEFIENLSILDLLFMEGPNAINYLVLIENFFFPNPQNSHLRS
ncbi:MAG: WbqC family protein [Flavobacteriaceae bacterium]|nr:WbqC family protein [Flavobacteriaceae bacterium]